MSILCLNPRYIMTSPNTAPKHPYEIVFSTMKMPYFSFSSFMIGSLILGFMGARIPFSEICPLSTCFTATPQGT